MLLPGMKTNSSMGMLCYSTDEEFSNGIEKLENTCT